MLALFRAGSAGPILVALAAGLFVFPYMVFSASAGQLADSRDKARLIRILKIAELALMGVAAAGFLLDSLPTLLLVLVGLGVQASLFGPLKYGILPDHLSQAELLAGNGLVEATTFLAILIGTMAGGWLVLLPDGPRIVATVGLSVAALGVAAALPIPPAPPRDRTAVEWNILRSTIATVRSAREHREIWRSILGISWFWTIGATLLAEFPVIAKVTLGASGDVVSLFLTMFSLGVGTGSLLCARVLRGRAAMPYAAVALFGISLFTADFAFAAMTARDLTSTASIISTPQGWRLLADLTLLSACGGFYSVPLYARIQQAAEPAWRARMVAANNIVNAAFMVAGATIAAGLAAAGVNAPVILLLAALINLMAVGGSARALRQSA